MPASLGFQGLSIEPPDVLVKTSAGTFSLDAVSGGIASVIDVAWQLSMFATSGKEFVVTFDEPENRLHPELQVRLLPGLIDAFPTAQFVVATHNPLVVSSSPDSQVIVLRYNGQHKVDSEELDFVEKA